MIDFEEINRNEFSDIPFAPEIEGNVMGGYGTVLALYYVSAILEYFF